jgi:uncharacterized membrane protein YfcA
MDYIVICAVALLVAGLTLFSGFGLGTLLMPAFALFFDLKTAVAATAVVHLLNNLFKLYLMHEHADWRLAARFAIPASAAAVVGALLLGWVSGVEPLLEYSLLGRPARITAVKIVIAALIAAVATFELHPRHRDLAFSDKYIPLGGALSGFFGGLSGLQGALRSAFLIKAGLGKEGFVGTAVVAAVVVDVSRLIVYGAVFYTRDFEAIRSVGAGLVIAGTAAAFLGSFIGKRLLDKVTYRAVQLIVGVMLVLLALALGAGII